MLVTKHIINFHCVKKTPQNISFILTLFSTIKFYDISTTFSVICEN